MLRPDTGLGFLVRLVFFYTILVIPWPGSGALYRDGIHWLGNRVLVSLWSGHRVQLEQPDVVKDAWDTLIRVTDLESGASWRIEMSCRHWGLVPTAVTSAFILATFMPWRRKVLAFFLGVLSTQLFVLFRFWLIVQFSLGWKGPPESRETIFHKVVAFLSQALAASPVESFLVPILIWLGLLAATGTPLPGLSGRSAAEPDTSPPEKNQGE